MRDFDFETRAQFHCTLICFVVQFRGNYTYFNINVYVRPELENLANLFIF